MIVDSKDQRLHVMLEDVELPERAYELAEKRYKDLGSWISREQSSLFANDPHIFVQGSFAFGTAIKPINPDEEFDLDFSCKLRKGVSRQTHSQEGLKKLVGAELELYRQARNISNNLVAKNRCWRLSYRDEMGFHMDVVPCIPADESRRRELVLAMESAGTSTITATEIAGKAIWITDKRLKNFAFVDQDWPSSNPEGYLEWFRTKLQPSGGKFAVEAKVNDVPVYRHASPLQQVVQLLKRHRDGMFEDNTDAKPVSIIITTVAARAYTQGDGLADTMRRVLDALEAIRVSNTDSITNPVNPKENFADRWQDPECTELRLKQNFHHWVQKAKGHFTEIMQSIDTNRLVEIANDNLRIRPDKESLRKAMGLTGSASGPRKVEIEADPAPPWSK